MGLGLGPSPLAVLDVAAACTGSAPTEGRGYNRGMLVPTLRTVRLVLRAPDVARDLDYIVRYAADAEAMRFIGTGETHGEEKAGEWLEGYIRDWDRVGHGRWTVALRDTGEAIGNCGFVRWREGEADERPELAYGYLREAWGRGYATEAGAAALEWGFAALPFDEVVAVTHPANVASQRVLAKLGFESMGEVVPSHGRTMAMFVAGHMPPDERVAGVAARERSDA